MVGNKPFGVTQAGVGPVIASLLKEFARGEAQAAPINPNQTFVVQLSDNEFSRGWVCLLCLAVVEVARSSAAGTFPLRDSVTRRIVRDIQELN